VIKIFKIGQKSVILSCMQTQVMGLLQVFYTPYGTRLKQWWS